VRAAFLRWDGEVSPLAMIEVPATGLPARVVMRCNSEDDAAGHFGLDDPEDPMNPLSGMRR